MKKLILLFFIAMFAGACDKDFGQLNVDKKNPPTVPPGTLFSFAQKELINALNNSNVNRNIFRLLAQQWTETTYIDEANYDLATRNIPQNFWNILYVNVLSNLKQSDALIPTQDLVFVPAEQQKNQHATIEILNVLAWSTLVNTFGDVPYSQALDIANVHPQYDKAEDIYNDLFNRLDAAIADINPSFGGFDANDLIAGGDMEQWLLFAHSLKMRLGMIIADVDEAKARSIVEAAAPNIIDENSENFIMHFLSSPPNTNQIWVDLVQSGRKDFVAANTLVDTMLALDDPRIPIYFTTDADGGYSGGIYGSSNNYATYSKPGDRLTAPDFEQILFDAAEGQFLLAEAVERGFNVGGTAEEHYNAAIRASMEYWGVAEADIDAYLAQPEVAYSTAPGDWRAKIGLQKWLALYNRGFDAWVEIRRLDNPVLVAPSDAVSGYPNRYTYPVQEQNLNTTNWQRASSEVGADGDVVESKLFWDIF
jgi:hypothetical protein